MVEIAKKLLYVSILFCVLANFSHATEKESDNLILSIQPKSILYYECFNHTQEKESTFDVFTKSASKTLISQYCDERLKSASINNYDKIQNILQRLKQLEPDSGVVQLLQFDNDLQLKKVPFETAEQFEKSLVRFRQLSPSLGEAWKADYRLMNGDLEVGYRILSKMPINRSCRSEYKDVIQLYYDNNTEFEEVLSKYLSCQEQYGVTYANDVLHKVHEVLSIKDELEYTLLEPLDYTLYVYEKRRKKLEEARLLQEQSKPAKTEKEKLLERFKNFTL